MTNQSRLDEGITDLFKQFERTLANKNTQAKAVVNATRLAINDILSAHADNRGAINPNQTASVLRNLPTVERSIYNNLRDEMRSSLRNTAEFSALEIASIIPGVLGTGALTSATIDLAGAAITAEVALTGLIGIGAIEFVTALVDSVFNRTIDGDQLNDRLRKLARVLTQEITTTLRNSIANGEAMSEIMRKLDEVYKGLDYHVDALIETESMYTMRQSVARIAEMSGIASALRITDFPHGHAHVHHQHKCYIYAHADEHGLGEGVYPLGTRKIRNPHPRCRSVLTIVLREEFR